MNVSLKDLKRFHASVEETPFPKVIPEFPVKKKPVAKQGLKDPEEPLPPHIPPFLPSFPDRHTYINTSVFDTTTAEDAKIIRQLRSKRKRQVQKAVIQLCNASGENAPRSYDYASQELDESHPNPFMRPPRLASQRREEQERATKQDQPTHTQTTTTSTSATSTSSKTPSPTPLSPSSSFVGEAFAKIKTEELKREEKEKKEEMAKKQKGQAFVPEHEAAETAKKKQRLEKIVHLSHESGMEESLDGLDTTDLSISIGGPSSSSVAAHSSPLTYSLTSPPSLSSSSAFSPPTYSPP
ncbi:Transcription initiation factor TFIID subunit 8 [Balamuthia mandrillaris]